MKISARRKALLACALSVSVLATACGGSDDNGEAAEAADISTCDPNGVTITAQYLEQGDTAAQAAKISMEAEFPGLTVNLKKASTTGYDQATQQMVADIAAGSRPDVAMIGLGQIRFWVDQYGPQPVDTAALSPTYDQRFLDIGKVDGTPYVAPFQVSVPVLYTNTTMTESVGVTSAPTTTSALLDNARKIKAANGTAPVQLPRDGVADWVAQAMIQSAGATFVEPDGQPGFDTDEGRAGLEIYETLGAEKLEDPVSATDALTMFNTGNLAYMVSSPASAANIQKTVGDKFNWTVTAMPIPDGGEASLPAGGNGWIVLSEDACKASFGNQLISHMLTPEVIAASSKSFSYIPVDKEAVTMLSTDPAAKSQLGYSWTYTGTPTPWGGWHGDATPKVNQFMQDMVQRLIGGEPLDPVLQDTVQRIQSAVR
jgi:multiple sugar transport system substrate-binding protein